MKTQGATMTKESESILQLLLDGQIPSTRYVIERGYSQTAIDAVKARDDVLSVQTFDIGAGEDITRLKLIKE